MSTKTGLVACLHADQTLLIKDLHRKDGFSKGFFVCFCEIFLFFFTNWILAYILLIELITFVKMCLLLVNDLLKVSTDLNVLHYEVHFDDRHS